MLIRMINSSKRKVWNQHCDIVRTQFMLAALLIVNEKEHLFLSSSVEYIIAPKGGIRQISLSIL